MYNFSVKPDITFYFQVPLETALNRILDNRPQLKYFEAGMDMGLSTDPYESFKLFQKQILIEYHKIIKEFQFTVINATEPVHVQQERVRQFISKQIDIPGFQWRLKR